MAVRRPIFELHIRPMFRVIDRMHMIRLPVGRRVDLSDYDQVKNGHQKIADFLTGGNPMPPIDSGGPWPQEWIDLFARWKDTGFGRLSKATVANLQVALAAPDRYVMTGTVAVPHAGATAWFEIVQANAGLQSYEVVMEEIPGAPPAPMDLPIEERIRGPLTTTEIIVVDAAGEHRLAVPAS
jgi:hypothetical protein